MVWVPNLIENTVTSDQQVRLIQQFMILLEEDLLDSNTVRLGRLVYLEGGGVQLNDFLKHRQICIWKQLGCPSHKGYELLYVCLCQRSSNLQQLYQDVNAQENIFLLRVYFNDEFPKVNEMLTRFEHLHQKASKQVSSIQLLPLEKQKKTIQRLITAYKKVQTLFSTMDCHMQIMKTRMQLTDDELQNYMAAKMTMEQLEN